MTSSPRRWRRSLPRGGRLALAVPTALLAITAIVAPSFADDVTSEDGGDTPAVVETPKADPAPAPVKDPAPDPAPPKEEPEPEPEKVPEPEPVEEIAKDEPQEIPEDVVSAGEEAEKGAQLVTKLAVEALDVAIDPDKVVVCKYSSTPEIGERAQTVNISNTSSLAPGWPGTFPWPFGDAHLNSLGVRHPLVTENTGDLVALLKLDEDNNTFLLCPPYEPPGLVTPPELTVNDPCGPDNAIYDEVPPGNYTVERHLDGSITLTADDGYVFPGDEATYTYPAPTDSGEPCPAQAPAEPAVTDPCGPDNAYFAEGDIPAETDEYTVDVNEDSTVITITAKPGYAFDPDEPVVYTAVDSDEPCPAQAPVEPQVTDPCGLDNAYYAEEDIPAETDAYTVDVNEDSTVITITAKPGYAFDPDLPIVFTAIDSGEACIVEAPPVPQTDPCGLDNAYFDEADIPKSTDDYTVSVNESMTEVTITATPGNVFDEEGTTEIVHTAEDSEEPCIVDAPPLPQPMDPCGPDNAYFSEADIPDGKSTDDYTVSVNESMTEITITATPGNVFDEEGTTEIVHTAVDSGEECPVYVACSYPSADDGGVLRSPVVVANGVIVILDEVEALLNGFLGTFPYSYTDGDAEITILMELEPGQDPGDLNAFTLCGSSEVGGYCEVADDKDAVDENGDLCFVEDEVGGIVETANLPNTGGPVGWLVPLGAALMMAGALLVMIRRPHSA